MTVAENMSAPDFELQDETGKAHKLSGFRGKPLVLYFYPKDDTPGCTTEACGFRDSYADYQKEGVIIIGISTDSPKSHAKFKEKYHLPFTLLADEDHKVCETYGVWVKKKLYGREYFGIARTTFLIDAEGVVLKVFKNVKPDGHSKEVLAALK